MIRLSNSTSRVSGKILILLMAGVFLSPSVYATETPAKVAAAPVITERSQTLTIGKADIVEIPGDVSDIMVANPSIVDVQVLQARRLYMVGAAIGDTNVIVLDSQGNVLRKINVHVRVDEATLQQTLRDLFPGETVRAKTVNSQVVLAGRVSSPKAADRIRDVASRFVGANATIVNLMDVAGEQQVMLRVRIVEASRDTLRELGIETGLNDGMGALSNSVSAGLAVTNRTGLTEDPFGIGTLIYNTDRAGLGNMEVLINALEQDNLINILAEPNLTAISGEQAGFLAGGEFPVPIGRDDQGNIQVEFRSFGVSLNFRPTVLSDERISLKLNTEVSSLSYDNAITLSQVQVPGLDVRRAETTVEMASGGSLMIAGLLKSDAVKGMSGLPGIKDTPILGDLISSRSFQRNETELVVLVTPYLVQPFADADQAKPAPVTQTNPLARAFASNIRRAFGKRAPEGLLNEQATFGYLLD